MVVCGGLGVFCGNSRDPKLSQRFVMSNITKNDPVNKRCVPMNES